MKGREKIFDDVANSLNCYFILGGDTGFNLFNQAFEGAEFQQKEEFPEYINDIIAEIEKKDKRIDFVTIAYKYWKKATEFSNEYEKEKRVCLRILNDMYK